MGRKVYVVSNGGHDYSDAQRFGEVVFCTEGVIRKDDTAQMYREIHASMSDASSEDFILVSSLCSLCMIAAGIFADRFGELHLLIFKDGQYIHRDIILESRQ